LDGGVFSQQASHHLDLLEWLVGDVESVFAKSINAFARIETEDTGVIALKFKNGALGLIEATTAIRPTDIEGSISILGSKGIVEVGGFAANEMKVWQFENKLPDDDEVVLKYKTTPPSVYGFGHYQYLKDVIDAIINKKKAFVDGNEGKKALHLIHAIYKSIETGKEVFLNDNSISSKLGRGK
jgi:predicted dehydrogenase